MNHEKSCGFVPFKEVRGKRHYLIIRSTGGDYGFPKGHMEGSETEHETAIRELREETNLEVTIIDGFRYQTEYMLPNKADTLKTCVYFLGKCTETEVICQEAEVSKAEFVPFETALELLTFEDTKRILMQAEDYLSSV